MPIRRDDFERGKMIFTDEGKVRAFFEQNEDSAYSTTEIARNLEYPPAERLHQILDKLQRERYIEKKEIGGEIYWIRKKYK